MHLSLIPFAPCPWVSRIDARFSLTGDTIVCTWALTGNTREIAWRFFPDDDRVAPDRVAPDRVAPDRVAPDRVAPDRVAPDRVAPDRVNNLWEHTCFEFFIGSVNTTRYYEFNLAPGGDWNTYSFSDVRQDMQETTRLICQSSDFQLAPGEAWLEARLQFSEPVHEDSFRVGIAAIVEGTLADPQSGRSHAFFALTHPGARPDFHHRDGHTLLVTRICQ
ncbi:MAG: hypothetical protein ACFHX7_01835 [Pseudomonadota bacterium]